MAEADARGFARASLSFGDWSLAHGQGGADRGDGFLDIKQGGRWITSIERGSSDGYHHLSYSFTPNGKTILSGGSNGVLTAYDRDGKKLGEFIGHESDVVALAASPDGRLLVSGAVDQTVRLWNIKTRELIVTLFHGRDGEWVMWTPQGYYTGSPKAGELVGWQINKGADKAADYVDADRLREFLYRPDIVKQAIILASAGKAVERAPRTNRSLQELLAR